MIKLGFIGYGNIAQAMVKGLLLRRNDLTITACAAHYDKLVERCKQSVVEPRQTLEEVVAASDIVIIAIKPYQIAETLKDKAHLFANKIIISFAAGWLNKDYEELLPGTHHLSAIPNTPIATGFGVTTYEKEHSLTVQELALAKELLCSVGTIEEVDSEHLGIANVLSGCGPAYAFMFVEALGDAGVKHGLTRSQSYRLAAAMLKGAGELLLTEGLHPGEAKDQVCSPGGLTIKGVCSLLESGFGGAVVKAIDEVIGK